MKVSVKVLEFFFKSHSAYCGKSQILFILYFFVSYLSLLKTSKYPCKMWFQTAQITIIYKYNCKYIHVYIKISIMSNIICHPYHMVDESP